MFVALAKRTTVFHLDYIIMLWLLSATQMNSDVIFLQGHQALQHARFVYGDSSRATFALVTSNKFALKISCMDEVVGLKIIICYLQRHSWRISHKALSLIKFLRRCGWVTICDFLAIVLIWDSIRLSQARSPTPTQIEIRKCRPCLAQLCAHLPSIVCNFGRLWECTANQYSPAAIDL